MIGIICTNCKSLHPMLVFPIVRYDAARMMHGVYDEAKGLAHPSGWMTSQNSIHVLNHFKENVRCNVNKKVLLIMENHKSDLSIKAIDFVRENGIVILATPPNTSNFNSLIEQYLDHLKPFFHNQ